MFNVSVAYASADTLNHGLSRPTALLRLEVVTRIGQTRLSTLSRSVRLPRQLDCDFSPRLFLVVAGCVLPCSWSFWPSPGRHVSTLVLSTSFSRVYYIALGIFHALVPPYPPLEHLPVLYFSPAYSTPTSVPGLNGWKEHQESPTNSYCDFRTILE